MALDTRRAIGMAAGSGTLAMVLVRCESTFPCQFDTAAVRLEQQDLPWQRCGLTVIGEDFLAVGGFQVADLGLRARLLAKG